MSGIYVLSYSQGKDNSRVIEMRGFRVKGLRYYLYVALKKIKGEQVEVVII